MRDRRDWRTICWGQIMGARGGMESCVLEEKILGKGGWSGELPSATDSGFSNSPLQA